MSETACKLDADEMLEQLERYRAIGRRAAAVEHKPDRVVVRFVDDPPSALIERTLEVERGCCPFFVIDYEPAARRLAISVDHPDRRRSLDAIARALGESRAADPLPERAQAQMRTMPGAMSCCSPSVLESCCEPHDKQVCCGQPLAGGSTVAAPSSCRCNA